MNSNIINKHLRLYMVKAFLGALLLSFSMAASAQGGILSTPRTGTFQGFDPDSDALIISGSSYIFNSEEVTITLDGEEVRARGLFQPGMVLRFTLRGDRLATIEVLGPYTMLEDSDNH